MNNFDADKFLAGLFTPSEQVFLLSLPEFKEALERATELDISELSRLGVQLLLTRGYSPPAKPESDTKAG